MHLDGKEGALAFAQSLQPTLCTPCTCERITYKSIHYKYTYTYTVQRQFKVQMLLALSHCALCKYKQAFVQLQLTLCTPCTICTHCKIVGSTLFFWILPNCPHCTFPSARSATFYEYVVKICAS